MLSQHIPHGGQEWPSPLSSQCPSGRCQQIKEMMQLCILKKSDEEASYLSMWGLMYKAVQTKSKLILNQSVLSRLNYSGHTATYSYTEYCAC